MEFQDKTLTCKECGKEFVWPAGEQQFYADKGLQNPPGRCRDCRKAIKDRRAQRPEYSIICKECKKEGKVPFEPRDPNDVLCAECFQKKRESEKAASAPTPEVAPATEEPKVQ